MKQTSRQIPLRITGVVLCLFTLLEVNYPRLTPQSQLAIFAMLGLTACFLIYPVHPRFADSVLARRLDLLPLLASNFCCLYIVVQTEPMFRTLWLSGQSLGNRAGQEVALDGIVGAFGIVLVLEATRRSLGLALPLLAIAFLAYASFGASLPSWMLPHRGYGAERIVSQTFLHSQGVFGVALTVMFTYVFLFVLLGVLLQSSGATQYIIDLARRAFHHSRGGPAKVAVLSSGLMGSLSGSAVANTATTGTFTIPMMRSSGFRAETAAGIEAAASSGGALVPPVMGAGAYMMLEIVDPPVTYIEIIRAALLPAILYYLSLWLIVHFHARRLGVAQSDDARPKASVRRYEGVIFVVAFAALLATLLLGYTAFRAVSVALLLGAVSALFSKRSRLTLQSAVAICAKACRDSVPLVAASACVGIVLGVVTLTGIGSRFPALLLPLAEQSLLLALALIMVSSLILGMGLPSAVCYLLLATLIGPILGDLGVVPLAAHLFIFYFGMMSMVTPPVALAAYTAASLAGTDIMKTSFTAFRFALVGFTLPYMFVFRPQLLMLDPRGGAAAPLDVAIVVIAAALGILAFAAALAGHLFEPLRWWERFALFVAAGLILFPGAEIHLAAGAPPLHDLAGFALLGGVAILNRRARREAAPAR